MTDLCDVPLSVLDLAPVSSGSSAAIALRNSRDLAQHAERLGYLRYWVAEHHNMPGIASSSPAVLIGYLADATSTIRLGSGGVMLPNHAPLVVAEQFGMLEAMHPGRIDLGIGRAPGTDQVTASATLQQPYAMVAASVICADSDERAQWLAMPSGLSFLRLRTGRPGLMPSPEEAADYPYTAAERQFIESRQANQIVGSPKTVASGLQNLLDRTAADELMLTTMVYDHADRLTSYELVAALHSRHAILAP